MTVWVLMGAGSNVPVLVAEDLAVCAAHVSAVHGSQVQWTIAKDRAVATVLDPRAPQGTEWRAYRLRVAT